MMSQPIQFQEAARVLKNLLKEKGITYRELAKRLSLSESSVKKLFISKDCSFQRMSEICGVLGITFADLMTTLQEEPVRVHRHTPAQEEFLVANPRAFHVYCKFVVEEMTVSEVKATFKISDAELFKILRSLDKMNLLQLQEGGEVKCPDMKMTLWENAGPLVAKMKQEWPQKLLDKIEGNQGQPGYRLTLRYYRMKSATLTEFLRALTELEFEFARRAQREERLERDKTIPVSMLSGVAPRSFIESL